MKRLFLVFSISFSSFVYAENDYTSALNSIYYCFLDLFPILSTIQNNQALIGEPVVNYLPSIDYTLGHLDYLIPLRLDDFISHFNTIENNQALIGESVVNRLPSIDSVLGHIDYSISPLNESVQDSNESLQSILSAIEGLELSPNITVECNCDCGGGGSGDDTGGGGSGDDTGGGGGSDSDGGSYSSELASIQASLDKLALESTLSSFYQDSIRFYEMFNPVVDYYKELQFLYKDVDWKPLRDNLGRLFETSFFSVSDSSLSYATVDFESNSVPHKVDISYSNMDFFEASLKFASDGNKINASATMLLKHLLDRMPDSKDTKEEESRITQSISETSQQLDSLRQSLELSEIKFNDTASDFFDGDTILRDLQNSSCPYSIILRIPEFMGFDEQVITIPVSPIEPLLDVSRAVFGCVYFVLIAGFAWFAFRLFVPVLSRFSKLLASVLNW